MCIGHNDTISPGAHFSNQLPPSLYMEHFAEGRKQGMIASADVEFGSQRAQQRNRQYFLWRLSSENGFEGLLTLDLPRSTFHDPGEGTGEEDFSAERPLLVRRRDPLARRAFGEPLAMSWIIVSERRERESQEHINHLASRLSSRIRLTRSWMMGD